MELPGAEKTAFQSKADLPRMCIFI